MGKISSYAELGAIPALSDLLVQVHTANDTTYSVTVEHLLGAFLGGDIGGSPGSPTVAKIQGTAVSAPAGGTSNFLNAAGGWTVPGGGSGGSGVLDWYSVTSYGASTSASAATNNSAFQDAWNAAKSGGGGVIYVPKGTWTLSATSGGDVSGTEIYWKGDGAGGATTVNWTGAGTPFKGYDSTNIATRTVNGGGIHDMCIDGKNATGSSYGFEYGDISMMSFNVVTQNFIYDSNSAGAHFINEYYWAEQMKGIITAPGCANGFIFEGPTASGGTSGSATGSYDRSNLRLFIIQSGNGNGMVIRNGVEMQGSHIYYGGNFSASSGTVYSSISVDATSSFYGWMHLDIEQDSASGSGTQPMTISVASGSPGFAGMGFLNWGASPGGWTATNGTSGQFASPYFNFIVVGDNTLAGYAKTSWAANT